MPLLFFWGEEDFLIEKEICEYKKRVLGSEINELNYKALDNPDFATLIFLLRSQSIMFSDTIYNIKVNRYFLDAGKKITLSDKQIEEFIEAISLIPKEVHCIFTCGAERGSRKKPDSRKKIFKAVQKYGTVKEFPAFKAYETYKILPVFKKMAQEQGLKGSDEVLTEIINKTGPYFRDLSAALEKISLFIYPNNIIDKASVDFIAPVSQNVFSLIDLILEKKYTEVMTQISNMLLFSHHLEILGFLQAGFSKILIAKVYSKTMSSFDIARKTGQNEYAVKMQLKKIKDLSLGEIIKLRQNLIKADFEIKTGLKDPSTALLEAFVR